MTRFLKLQPTAIAGALRAVLLAGTAFGLDWTPEQIAALMLAVEAVLTLVVFQNVVPSERLVENGLVQSGGTIYHRPEPGPAVVDVPPEGGQVHLGTVFWAAFVAVVVVFLGLWLFTGVQFER